MKKYFLHNGTESSGPFDFEELKIKKITKTTPVWFEGMEHWKIAGEIDELKSVFLVIPPPIASFSEVPPAPIQASKQENRKIMGLSKYAFWAVSGFLIVAVGTIVLNTLQENRSQELKLKNHKTEVENYQLELKQKELEEEKIQAVIQEKIEAERLVRDKKQSANNRLSEIEKKLMDYQNNLDETEKKLNNASGFKLLRTTAEKKEQMDLLQKNIDSFKNEMVKLKNESDQLKLELEKIP
jgi:chromosome segregation ATPase